MTDMAGSTAVAEIDELRAENEALQEQAFDLTERLLQCSTEIERLRAAIAELQQDVERLQQQRAEQVLTNERLRNLLAECFPLVRPGTDLSRRLRETLD